MTPSARFIPDVDNEEDPDTVISEEEFKRLSCCGKFTALTRQVCRAC